jgi:hypothetical protein
MRRVYLLGTALGAALLASPTLAQPMSPSGSASQGGAGMRQGWSDSQQATPGSLPQQDRDAVRADRMGMRGPVSWLSQAQDAVRRGHLAEANELVERAETRVLSRSEPVTTADQPMRDPFVQHTSAARAALTARDREGAMREIDLAMQAARDMRDATGDNAAAMPMQGGSGMYQGYRGGMSGPGQPPAGGYGTSTMHDQGYGGSSMSRADHVGPLTRPASPIQRAQSSGGAGNVPASPMRGSPSMSGGTDAGAPGAGQPGMAPPPLPGAGGSAGNPGTYSGGSVGGTAGIGTPPSVSGGMGTSGSGAGGMGGGGSSSMGGSGGSVGR